MSHTLDFNIAFDYFSSPIVFLNLEYDVFYLNFKALSYFKEQELQFKKIDEKFNPYDILDNHSVFFQNVVENKQTEILEMKLGDHVQILTKVGKRHLELNLTPIFDTHYARTATCIEIKDVTPVIKALAIFDESIDLAQKGHFDLMIPTENLEDDDPEKHIFEKVNTLFSTLNHFVRDIALGLENLAGGNLNFEFSFERTEEHNYFNLIKDDFNYTVEKIKYFIKNINNVSNTMNQMISQVMMSNSNFAMIIETEFLKAGKSKENLDEYLHILKNSNSEIQQATSVIDIGNRDFKLLNQLDYLMKNLNVIGQQINEINEVSTATDLFFRLHLDGLKLGIDEMNSGNLGKGVNLIRNECDQMISKVNYSMSQIKNVMQNMKMEFKKSSTTVHDIVDVVHVNTSEMSNIIKMLTETITAIKSGLEHQDVAFDKFGELTENIDALRSETMTSIESMICTISNLVSLSDILSKSINIFKFEIEYPTASIDEIQSEDSKKSEDSFILLW